MNSTVPTSVLGMASKKTTPEKKQAPSQSKKKAPAKKAVAKKAVAKKASVKKEVAKKAPAKKAVAKKQPAKKYEGKPKFVNTSQFANTTTSSSPHVNTTVTMSTPAVNTTANSSVTNTVIKMNDVKTPSLRKRMLRWFKKS